MMFNGMEQAFPKRRSIACIYTTLNKLTLLISHLINKLFTNDLTQTIRFYHAITCKSLSNLHNLFLEYHQTLCLTKYIFRIFVEERDWLPIILAVGIIIMHVRTHRARSVQGYYRSYVINGSWSESKQKISHRARL